MFRSAGECRTHDTPPHISSKMSRCSAGKRAATPTPYEHAKHFRAASSCEMIPICPEYGQVYDRCAIDSGMMRHQRTQQLELLARQWPHASMAPEPSSAVQVCNMINSTPESSTVKADLWAARMEEEKHRRETEQLQLKAIAGDADAMWRLGARLGDAKRGG